MNHMFWTQFSNHIVKLLKYFHLGADLGLCFSLPGSISGLNNAFFFNFYRGKQFWKMRHFIAGLREIFSHWHR